MALKFHVVYATTNVPRTETFATNDANDRKQVGDAPNNAKSSLIGKSHTVRLPAFAGLAVDLQGIQLPSLWASLIILNTFLVKVRWAVFPLAVHAEVYQGVSPLVTRPLHVSAVSTSFGISSADGMQPPCSRCWEWPLPCGGLPYFSVRLGQWLCMP